ncbi:MAG: thiol:disulfide interchange protein DsbA/DsbL [Pseudomonadota bacterium]
MMKSVLGKWTLATLLTFGLAAVASAQLAPGSQFEAGKHYRVIDPAQPTSDAGSVEVVEVFGYPCPHCANFQPHIEPWVEGKPERVTFSRVPVVFQRSWDPLARAYYTAEVLGVLDQTHKATFRALHQQRRPLRNNQDLAKFFSEFGVAEADYLKTAESFSVETQMRKGATLTRRWGVTGTPSVVINGKYLITGSMAGSYERMLQIIDYLVGQEIAQLPAADAPVEEVAEEAASSE